MQVLSILRDASLEDGAEARQNCGSSQAAREDDANADIVFESACRFIVMNSLPGWIEAICAEHLHSVQPDSTQIKGLGDQA
jgi:hypothetical protein